MKHTLFIFALITASIQTFAQSPRIKLNQITKDSVTGSVLISSPTDSGMVYSRDLFISYGADTVLILGGDTLAKTSGIISSVLSDGVTITGDGTTGSELTADTSVLATLRALSDSLALVISSVTADGVTITGDGTVGSPLKVDTATVIATKQDLDLYYLDSNPDGYTSNTGTVTNVSAGTQISGMGMTITNGTTTPSIATSVTNAANFRTAIGAGTGNGTVTSVGGTGTVNGISLSGTVTSSGNLTLGGTLSNVNLASQVTGTLPIANGGTGSATQNFVDLTTTQTVGGAKTFTSALTQSGGDVNFDSGTFFVDESLNRVGIGTSTPTSDLDILGDGVNSVRILVDGNGVERSGASAQMVFRKKAGYGFAVQILSDSATAPGVNVESNVSGAGQMRLRTDGGIAGMNFIAGGSTQPIRFIQSTTPRLIVNSGGEILIGYESDEDNGAYKLQVNSQIFATSSTIATSDIKYKTNILDLENGLDLLMRLKPKTYDFRQNPIHNFSSETQVGFIAQEVQEVFSNKNYLNSIIYQNNGYLGMAYEKIIPITVKAIQEQQAIIESQASEIEQLKSQIQLILSEIEQIKNN